MKDAPTEVAGGEETWWERRDRLNCEARDIVRRLAETPEDMGPTFRAGHVTQLIKEARSLWSEMQREPKGGGDDQVK